MSKNEIFSFEDLFITVRNTQLRAYNRLMLATNFEEIRGLSRRYLRHIQEIDGNGMQEISLLKRQIRKHGLITVQKQIKFFTNPYSDVMEEAACKTQSSRLYQPLSM